LGHSKPTTLNEMIKRYEIRPRRKRAPNGNGVEAPVAPAPAAPVGSSPDEAEAHAGPLAPGFEDKEAGLARVPDLRGPPLVFSEPDMRPVRAAPAPAARS